MAIDQRILDAYNDNNACWQRRGDLPCVHCVQGIRRKLGYGWTVERIVDDITEFKRLRRLRASSQPDSI